MKELQFSKGELRRIISEENEFKPVVFGSKETKETNKKAYADEKKKFDEYGNGINKKEKLEAPGRGIGNDDNKGMSDLMFADASKPYTDRVGAQMKGYASKQAEELHKDAPFGNADFDDDEKIYKWLKDHAKAVKNGKDTATEIGLTGRELDKKEVEKLRKTMFGENKIKKLTFKKTRFISEGHMLSKVPDDYKKDGNKFIMKDSYNNEYLVEWNSKEPNVTKKTNMSLVNEEKERIKSLWEYRSSAQNTTTPSFRLQENKEVGDMVKRARELMK